MASITPCMCQVLSSEHGSFEPLPDILTSRVAVLYRAGILDQCSKLVKISVRPHKFLSASGGRTGIIWNTVLDSTSIWLIDRHLLAMQNSSPDILKFCWTWSAHQLNSTHTRFHSMNHVPNVLTSSVARKCAHTFIMSSIAIILPFYELQRSKTLRELTKIQINQGFPISYCFYAVVPDSRCKMWLSFLMVEKSRTNLGPSWQSTSCIVKGTSGGPRHCIWTPDCPLKLYWTWLQKLTASTGIWIVHLGPPDIPLTACIQLDFQSKAITFPVNYHPSFTAQWISKRHFYCRFCAMFKWFVINACVDRRMMKPILLPLLFCSGHNTITYSVLNSLCFS